MIAPARMFQLDQGAEPRTPEEHQHRAWRIRQFPPIRIPRGADTFQESDWTEHPFPQSEEAAPVAFPALARA